MTPGPAQHPKHNIHRHNFPEHVAHINTDDDTHHFDQHNDHSDAGTTPPEHEMRPLPFVVLALHAAGAGAAATAAVPEPVGVLNATVFVLDAGVGISGTPARGAGDAYSVQLGAATLDAAGALAVVAGWLIAGSEPPAPSFFTPAVLEYNGLAGTFSEHCEVLNPADDTVSWRCEQQGIVTNCNCSVYPAGHGLFRAGAMRRNCACRRMMELAVGVRHSRGPGGLATREFSTPAPGRCAGKAGQPCTWRLPSSGKGIAAACARRGLAQLLPPDGNVSLALERALAAAGSASALWGAAVSACAAAAPAPGAPLPVGGAAVNTGVRTVGAFRLTPAHLKQALANMDSADLYGDLFFGVFEAQFQCTNSSAGSTSLYMCRDSPDDEGHAYRHGPSPCSPLPSLLSQPHPGCACAFMKHTPCGNPVARRSFGVWHPTLTRCCVLLRACVCACVCVCVRVSYNMANHMTPQARRCTSSTT